MPPHHLLVAADDCELPVIDLSCLEDSDETVERRPEHSKEENSTIETTNISADNLSHQEDISKPADGLTLKSRMPLKASERDVYELFSKASKVKDVCLIMDRNSRRSKGVGYALSYSIIYSSCACTIVLWFFHHFVTSNSRYNTRVVVDVGVSKEELSYAIVKEAVQKYGVPFKKQNKAHKKEMKVQIVWIKCFVKLKIHVKVRRFNMSIKTWGLKVTFK
ncbi:uncharacterized protein HKW66_Vig0178490 [Vigna angularis]|uniref:RRM domain-containing protein n=1 Tax=Phaseolus angularis TaxID=3914 RepID=A0A8T0JY47_PHAAN|nr:uncharacterized protein HKW66_Vig0178490 [Vigna angularis]